MAHFEAFGSKQTTERILAVNARIQYL